MSEKGSSDQCYDWSDIRHIESLNSGTAAETQASGGPAASPGDVLVRFLDRALQALWQSGLQMRFGAGAWPEVLSVGQPVGLAPPDGLRALRVSATGPAVRDELSASSRDPQGNLRYQSRTVATTATTVDRSGDCHRHSTAGGPRPTGLGGRSGCQHAPGLFPLSTAPSAAGGTAR